MWVAVLRLEVRIYGAVNASLGTASGHSAQIERRAGAAIGGMSAANMYGNSDGRSTENTTCSNGLSSAGTCARVESKAISHMPGPSLFLVLGLQSRHQEEI